MSGSYVRRKKRLVDNYTQVSNTLIRDRRVTPKAKGVAVWLLSHSTEYRFTTDAIAEHLGVGVDQVKSAIRELETYGYLERVVLREGGRHAGMEYLLDDDPQVSTVVGTVSGKSTDGKPAGGETTDGSAADGEPVDGEPGGHIEDEVPRTSLEEDHHAGMHDDLWAIIAKTVSTPVDRAGRNSVRTQLAAAFDAGWTPETLGRWVGTQVADARGLSRPAAFVVSILRDIPAPSEVAPSRREVDDERAAKARDVAAERARARAECTMCDDEGYIGTRLCDHDPEQAERNREGAARARAALDELASRRGTGSSRQPAAPSGGRTQRRSVR